MRLQAEPPTGMSQHAGHGVRRIQAGAGLKEKVRGRQLLVRSKVLALIHHLDFIHAGEPQLPTLLGRTRHPVNAPRQRLSSVRLNADILPYPMKCVQQRIVYPQRRLPAGQDQNGHFRLQPEKRMNTAGVPV